MCYDYKNKRNEIKKQRGIFQGDSLSDLWFCMRINSLSSAHSRGFETWFQNKAPEYTTAHTETPTVHRRYSNFCSNQDTNAIPFKNNRRFNE